MYSIALDQSSLRNAKNKVWPAANAAGSKAKGILVRLAAKGLLNNAAQLLEKGYWNVG
jgi:hypothetical protein